MTLAECFLQLDNDQGRILHCHFQLPPSMVGLLESSVLSRRDELMLIIDALRASHTVTPGETTDVLSRVMRWSIEFSAADGRRHRRAGSPGSTWDKGIALPKVVDAASSRKVTRCRSILGLVNRALPRGVRDDMLDEWMDDIETAAEEGMPVRRRMVSIVLRSLPAIAWRSRRPTRAREGGA